MRNVLKWIFEFMKFFFAIFSFWDMVDFVLKILSKLETYTIVSSTVCELGSETLWYPITNWLGRFNPKVYGA